MLQSIASKAFTDIKEHPRLSKDQEVMAHDGKQIVVRHGPEATTGTGNKDYVMVMGTKDEIENEIAKLGLKPPDGQVKAEEIKDADALDEKIGP